MRRAAALGAAVALLLTAVAAWAPSAPAQELRSPASLDVEPDLRQRTGREVAAIAGRVPEVRAELERVRGETRSVYLKGATQWQVSWFTPSGPGRSRMELAQVTVDDRTGAVL